jgi:hypothetical protein
MSSDDDGSIKTLTLGGVVNNRVGSDAPVKIIWTISGVADATVEVEYSLDSANTWNHIATVSASAPPVVLWTTPSSGSHDAALIRVTSSNGTQKISDAFRIRAHAAAPDSASAEGYSITNFPNPASGSTTFRFLLPVRSFAKIGVVDAEGRDAGTVAWRSFEAGGHSIPFDASGLPNGVYTYTLEVGTVRIAGTMTIVK